MKLNHLSTAAVVALFAAGCAHIPSVGPNYHKPETKAPTQWDGPFAGGETNAPVEMAWWKNFHDAELNSLVERAAGSNLDLRMAQARVREARAQYSGAFADLWPTVDGAAGYSRLRAPEHAPVLGTLHLPPGSSYEDDLHVGGFDASWEIDVFGGKRRAVEAAKAQFSGAEFGQRDVLVTLLGEVARNYVELRGYQKRLAIANQNIEAQEKSLAITQNRFTNGVATDLDVQQATTVLSSTRAVVPTLESLIETTTHRLEVLLGQQPGTLHSELAEAAPIPAQPPQVPVGLPSDLLLRRPDVSRAERQLAAATANIGVAKSDLFPKFYLTGLAGLESVSADDWFTSGSRFWSVGPTVQWRIFDAGRIRANIKVHTARQQQALASYEQTVLTAFEEVEDNLVLYAKEQTRRRSLEAAVNASQKTLDTANRLYASGLTDFIHVLDAERSLYQAQDSLAQSDRTIAANLIALYKSLGGGWETMTQSNALASAQAVK
ncbi:MAG TPA: efflux transporter outer membrane subunit [Verrucomicrobiae bacterium]